MNTKLKNNCKFLNKKTYQCLLDFTFDKNSYIYDSCIFPHCNSYIKKQSIIFRLIKLFTKRGLKNGI